MPLHTDGYRSGWLSFKWSVHCVRKIVHPSYFKFNQSLTLDVLGTTCSMPHTQWNHWYTIYLDQPTITQKRWTFWLEFERSANLFVMMGESSIRWEWLKHLSWINREGVWCRLWIRGLSRANNLPTLCGWSLFHILKANVCWICCAAFATITKPIKSHQNQIRLSV